MNATELHQYIQQPDALTASSLEEIRQALAAYPYFQTLKMLYLKNLYLLKHPDFAQELERLAIGVVNLKEKGQTRSSCPNPWRPLITCIGRKRNLKNLLRKVPRAKR